MTQTSTTRRAATVSGGVLLLCMSFGGTALAATTPSSGTDLDPVSTLTDPVSTLTDPLPLPSPSDLPEPIQSVTQTVDQTVQQLSQTTGVPLPTATPTVTPAPAPAGGKTTGSQNVPTTTVKIPTATRQGAVLGTQHSRPAVAPVSLDTLQLGGLRGTTSAPSVTDPVIAPQQTAVLAAGQTPALAPKASGPLGGGDSDGGSTPRGLLIAVATMVIGGLTAGHVKVVQDQAKRVTTG